MNILVLGGLGKVGSAVVEILKKKHKVGILDLGYTVVGRFDLMAVCIPYSEIFTGTVSHYMTKYGVKTTVIHSTVPVGTTEKLRNCVHAPVRGQHDDLRNGIKDFVMFFGGPKAKKASEVYKDCGVKVKTYPNSRTTELLKLLCLSRFLNDLAWYENASRICRTLGVRKDTVTDWMKTYNQGYKGSKFVRPDLKFPEGVVGGSCVKQGVRLLVGQTEDLMNAGNLELFGN